MAMLTLQTPIEDVFMIGPVYAQRLNKLDIFTVEDLLYHYPTRYEDFTIKSPISSIQPGEIVTITANISTFKNIYTKYGKKIQQAQVSDDTGLLDVIWYNQPFLANILKVGQKINLSGKVDWFKNKVVMESPVYEFLHPPTSTFSHLDTIHTGRLVPIYPETYGVSSKWLRSRIAPILRQLKNSLPEFLPADILKRNNLLIEKEAISQIHFPDSLDLSQKARQRLSFDELFLIQLASLQRKKQWQAETVGHQFKISPFKKELNNFITHLPFTLTSAQRRSVGEILTDLGKTTPMNRLLEGEVGSGKTVVATVAMFMAYLNKYQVALMAPTEILAQQHYQTVQRLLSPFKIKVILVSKSSKLNPEVRGQSSKLLINIYIGTHALLSENILFDNLGLVVIDEQQRFGVEQRATLKAKGINPHLLTMTATPIPRTMALTLYGELDLSLIDELPQNRKRVKTWVVPRPKREAAYRWIEKQLKLTQTQAFVICPLIEESETLTSIKAAKQEYLRLKKEIFPHLSLGLLHGKLKNKEKTDIIENYKNKKIDILVATPIVEVGIDIPNATIMLIEGSDRFGLTQLHQLRGRVGRGKYQGYCLLFSESDNQNSLKRIKSLETNFIGSLLAEIDLTLRGPGEIFGTRQHGITHLKIAALSDIVTSQKTRLEAKRLIDKKDKLLQFGPLQKALEKYTIKNVTQD